MFAVINKKIYESSDLPIAITLSCNDKRLIDANQSTLFASRTIQIKVEDIFYNIDEVGPRATIVLDFNDINTIGDMDEDVTCYCAFPVHKQSDRLTKKAYMEQITDFMSEGPLHKYTCKYM